MKYYEINMTIEPCSQDAQDLLAALTAEAGMETFEETETGLKGYAQQQLMDEEALQQAIDMFPIEGVTISYTISEAEDKDWNEQWEQEGFEPIEVRCEKVDGRCAKERTLVIHDGRHLPSDISHQPSAIMIEIDAHMAFGTGTHETTRMMLTLLLTNSNATNKAVTWASSNSSVATVNNGNVNAIAVGTANITATAGGKGQGNRRKGKIAMRGACISAPDYIIIQAP